MKRQIPSSMDNDHYQLIRKNIRRFMKHVSKKYSRSKGLLLDVAPQIHEGAKPFFKEGIKIETLDIDPKGGCTYTADICKKNPSISGNRYDFIVCTEVIEHVVAPWEAISEIRRLLKPKGLLFLSTPFNFRIHGPLPDCWRFSEHGLRELLKSFKILELKALQTPGRPLMPIHYTVVAKK